MKRALTFTALALLAAGCGQQAVTQNPKLLAKIPTGDAPKPIAVQEPTDPETDPTWGLLDPRESNEYAGVVDKVSNMVGDPSLSSRVQRRALSLVNVTWEDTVRFQGSSVGPNISDLTLQVRRKDAVGNFHQALMPVIRHPNFTDRTGDVPADRFFVRVGNEQSGNLRSMPLVDVLKNL